MTNSLDKHSVTRREACIARRAVDRSPTCFAQLSLVDSRDTHPTLADVSRGRGSHIRARPAADQAADEDSRLTRS
jgi:hypothetical protein